jgi:hypothetical protein
MSIIQMITEAEITSCSQYNFIGEKIRIIKTEAAEDR